MGCAVASLLSRRPRTEIDEGFEGACTALAAAAAAGAKSYTAESPVCAVGVSRTSRITPGQQVQASVARQANFQSVVYASVSNLPPAQNAMAGLQGPPPVLPAGSPDVVMEMTSVGQSRTRPFATRLVTSAYDSTVPGVQLAGPAAVPPVTCAAVVPPRIQAALNNMPANTFTVVIAESSNRACSFPNHDAEFLLPLVGVGSELIYGDFILAAATLRPGVMGGGGPLRQWCLNIHMLVIRRRLAFFNFLAAVVPGFTVAQQMWIARLR